MSKTSDDYPAVSSNALTKISEGSAVFVASTDKDGKISKELNVFYNPVMRFNRHITIALLNSLERKSLALADIMAGSGVRSLRFLLELNKGIVGSISVNDYSENFPKLFKKNIALNKSLNSDFLKNKRLSITNEDANRFLLSSTGFDYIDIDPFGSPNDFLENSIVRLSRNGILAVTATDTAALAGAFPDACMRKYWAKPLRNHMMHEIGLRILIRKCQLIGATHEKALLPLYSFFKDHYFRIFFSCEKGRAKCDNVLRQHKYFLCCTKCFNSKISECNSERCAICDENMLYAGPLWVGELYDEGLAEKINHYLNYSYPNLYSGADKNFVKIIHVESHIHTIGFYDVPTIFSSAKKPFPKFEVIKSKIRALGYNVSKTHFSHDGIRTAMPAIKWEDILKKL